MHGLEGPEGFENDVPETRRGFVLCSKEEAAKSCLQVGSARHICRHGFALRHIWDPVLPLLSTGCVGLGKLPNLSVSPFSHRKRGTFSRVAAVGMTHYIDLEMLSKV